MAHFRDIRITASEERLWKLIESRLATGADTAAIDQRIWDLFGETWAVMFTDLSGFSRRVAEFGIIHFLQVIHESQKIFEPCIELHDGILLKTEGDSMLVIFRNAGKALDAALAMQFDCARYNQGRPETDKILLCIGLGFGPVIRIGDADVFGSEVNAASKLGEDTASAWEIMMTGAFHEAVAGDPALKFEQLSSAPSGAETAFQLIYDRPDGK